MNDTEILKHNNKAYTELVEDLSKYTKLSEKELLKKFNPDDYKNYMADIKYIFSMLLCFKKQYKNYTA